MSLENLKFLRHCDSRWLSLLPAVERLHKQLPALKKYFLEFIPAKEKRSTNIQKFKSIHETLKKEEGMILVKMCFLESVKPLFDVFLTAFQTEGPMIHVLYPSLVDMLQRLMSRFIKEELLQAKNGSELAQIDVAKFDNQLSDGKFNLNSQTRAQLQKLPTLRQKECLMGIGSFFSKATAYLQDKLPYKNKVLKALPCLHPDLRAKASSERQIVVVATLLPCCDEDEVPLIVDEWKMYREAEIPKDWTEETMKDGSKKYLRVDKYWAIVLSLNNAAGNDRFKVLLKVIKCALTLAHGNADTERILSVNKKIMTKERANTNQSTLIGIRLARDDVICAGGQPTDVKVTKQLLGQCKLAHAEYKRDAEERKAKEREEKRKKDQEEEKKRCAEEEEKRRLEKMKNLSEQNMETD